MLCFYFKYNISSQVTCVAKKKKIKNKFVSNPLHKLISIWIFWFLFLCKMEWILHQKIFDKSIYHVQIEINFNVFSIEYICSSQLTWTICKSLSYFKDIHSQRANTIRIFQFFQHFLRTQHNIMGEQQIGVSFTHSLN